jgi:hypothetical protein
MVGDDPGRRDVVFVPGAVRVLHERNVVAKAEGPPACRIDAALVLQPCENQILDVPGSQLLAEDRV